MFYAFNYIAGLASGTDGNRYGNYYFFKAKKERDLFVEQGSDYINNSNYREVIKASDPELKKKLREANRNCNSGMSWENSLWDAGVYDIDVEHDTNKNE